MTRSLLGLWAAVFAALPLRAEPPSAKAADVGLDAAKLAEIPKAMAGFVERKQAAGIVTLVARRGKVAAVDAVGFADLADKRPMTPDTLFWIASMSKPISAAALMILVDEGKLSVDDLVGKYIPEFNDVKLKDGKAPAKPLTIRHLLTHTSGAVSLPNDPAKPKPTLAEQSVTIAKQPLAFEPGSKWAYGGLTNITVCGRIVEIVSGKAFDAFLAERIFGPLGMKDTGFTPNAAQKARLAKIYKPGKEKGTLEPTTTPWINHEGDPAHAPNPSGGLFSTAADIAAFYSMLLNGGEADGKRILSSAAIKEMTRIHTGDLTAGFVPGSGWGLGFGVVKEPVGVCKAVSVGTFGHGGAFGTQSWADPKTGMIYILMVQRSNFGNSDGSDIRGALQDLAAAAVKE